MQGACINISATVVSAVIAVGAGQNQPAALVRLAMGEKVKPYETYEVGKTFIRYSWDMIIDIEQFQHFSAFGEN